MYRFIRILYILLALPALLTASVTVRGKVLDGSSQEPIVGANVVVMGTDEGGATDIEGCFEFPTTHSYPFTLEVTHIGFQRKEVYVSVDTLLIITLEPAFLMGEDVIVIGDRSQVGAEVSSAINVLTSRMMESYGARDVGDALRPLPSVVINASATGKQTVSIRGSNPNEVAVFLDGLRLNDSNTGMANLSAIDLNDLERVEVVKGGSTTLFGQGSFGGVVSLTSHLPDSNQVTFSRGYGLTDASDQDLSFSASGRLGIFAAGGRYSGKSRRYDGNTLYTNLFNSMSAAAYPRFGELVAKQYRLNNYLELPVGGEAQSDHMALTTLTYKGSLLGSSDWTFFLGYRNWGWTDHFFTNLERQLEEGNVTGRIAKQIINRKMSSILQLSYEEQNFNGNNSLYDSVLETFIHDSARLERINLGYAAVMRIIDEDLNPLASQVRLEISLRGDQFITNHLQDTWTTDLSGI
ncbi:MAG: TonB-dependent receptor plug domain-containing protein, partial [Candidatus Neomarinimicrobiota bacterium]